MYQSEVTQLRLKISTEYEAMKRGLNGFAWGSSRHSFIDARMKNVDNYHNQLSQFVGAQEATRTIFELYTEVIG